MFGLFKKNIKNTEIRLETKVKQFAQQKASDVKSIKDIEQFYQYASSGTELTFDQMVSIFEDPIVKSKSNLLLNKSKTYYKALNREGVKVGISKYIDNVLLKTVDWNDFDRYVFYSKPFGKSVILLNWLEDGNGGHDLVGFRHLDPRLFTINQDTNYGDIGDLMLNLINLTKLYPMNFICIKNDVNFLYQGGQSDLRQIKDIVAFKRLLIQIKSNYFQKSVIPAFAITFETDKEGEKLTEQIDLLSAAANNIQNGSGLALANVKNVVALQQNGQVNFERTEELLNKTISVRILGSDLTDSQAKGTYGQAAIGSEYIEGNVKELGSTMQQFRNLVLKYAVYAKFGDEVAPEYVYDFNEPYPESSFKFMQDSVGYCSFYEFSKVYPMPRSIQAPKDDILYLNDMKLKELTDKIETDKANKETSEPEDNSGSDNSNDQE